MIGTVSGNVEYTRYTSYFCFVLCTVHGFVISIMRDFAFLWCCECLRDKCVSIHPTFGKDSMGDFPSSKKRDVYNRLKRRFEEYRRHQNTCSTYYDNTINNIYEQQSLETLNHRQRWLDSKAKKASKQSKASRESAGNQGNLIVSILGAYFTGTWDCSVITKDVCPQAWSLTPVSLSYTVVSRMYVCVYMQATFPSVWYKKNYPGDRSSLEDGSD